jgi:hypothetical protein
VSLAEIKQRAETLAIALSPAARVPIGTWPADVLLLLARIDELERRDEEFTQIVYMALPALGGHARGFSQEALIRGCALVGSKPEDWTHHPETMEARREALGMPNYEEPA